VRQACTRILFVLTGAGVFDDLSSGIVLCEMHSRFI
jgi:hypothetical protein